MEPRAGCWLPVRVEQVVNGALLVTVSCGQRSFAGILLDCTKKSGLFGPPPSAPLPQAEDAPVNGCQGPAPPEGDTEAIELGTGPLPPPCPEPPPPLVPPLPAGSLPPFPPYFEGAPFPPPLWLRNTYGQWVPQPPPRTIKRTRRRLSRNRDPGRLALSPICLRPRRVLCEKCKSTVSPPEASLGPPATPRPRRRLGSSPDPDRELHKHEDPDGRGDTVASAPARRSKQKRRKEGGQAGVPRSPAIKISYSTPQGKGEVVEIPSRVHGSLEPFCAPQDPEALRDKPPGGPFSSIPKLKLTRPVPPGADLPPPKIRLKPHRLGVGEQEPIYRAELVEELNGHGRGPQASSPAPLATGSAPGGLADVSSGSSGEDDDFRRCPQGKPRRDGLAFLTTCPRSRADCASESVCSSDSLDESKSSSSEVTSLDTCDFSSGDGVSVPSSSKDTGQTVPPLTVRLHTQSVSKCITEDGRTVAVGDIVWGKIRGFPWWPARVLDISLSQKEDGEPSWQEAKVSWFGSPTTSFLSTSKLSPFSEFFKLRFNRKKKGLYRKAITEAASAARHVAPEVRELLTQFET
ncbi:PREDICTED: PWWP domain-containing protein 2B isoform X1 [Hipposideros armiger]|uniref:PWWP domain-containing protein 2B isoform X1 n=1 Tax=Hipposideros armiger TaxID=186990 RepID=A0A8B7RF06_HIPAR|nr:PREDICTED: PWWP domain-containing protein 2B isoform X1 [Hipposideros armiger]XP_019499629.1 PREDICTED: PWWP domain-containing protein 2B isoform X1 [Hipposideros armiger]XP_019499630.1 PREDICTED: PWWP domain-containing protein 2B isoform X1 [Hipposideros armiger]